MRDTLRAAMLSVGLVLVPLTGTAQDVETDIQAVISEQIAALQADDFETAFSYASPGIKQLFGGPERFGQMVVEGYPMVWRPAEVRFSGIEERAGRTIQNVLVKDQDGALHVLEYAMVRTDQGWQIDGVMLRRATETGA